MINWFPGHMAQSRNQIQEAVRAVDIILELVDARLPLTSRNPDFVALTPQTQKPRLLVMTKSDLADPAETKAWLKAYRSLDPNLAGAIAVDLKEGKDLKRLQKAIAALYAPVLAKAQAKGRRQRTARLLCLGVPNCGKSTLTNKLCARRSAQVENRPGVTRSFSYLLSRDKNYLLLDSPGILPPRLDDFPGAALLAALGTIPQHLYPPVEVSSLVLACLKNYYPDRLCARYQIREGLLEEIGAPLDYLQILDLVGQKKGFSIKDEGESRERAGRAVLQDLQTQAFGRVTLERPDQPRTSFLPEAFFHV